MSAVEAQRTVVKSVPELWAALSDATMLDELLGEPFGEIRIARLEPETKIDWESDLAHGSVEFATSVFGTRMRLTAEIEPPPPPPPEPPAPPPAPRCGPASGPPAAAGSPRSLRRHHHRRPRRHSSRVPRRQR